MSPITHLLVGWIALERGVMARRDKALVCLAGVAPDLDGIGIVVDFATRQLGLPETDYYQTYHRMVGHGLPAAIIVAMVAGCFGVARIRTALLALLAFHLHLLCDILGSRGETAEDIWPIYYLAPWSTGMELRWVDQWHLIGWQNFLITATLMFWAGARATRLGYSPLSLVSGKGDGVLVATLRTWRQRLRGGGR